MNNATATTRQALYTGCLALLLAGMTTTALAQLPAPQHDITEQLELMTGDLEVDFVKGDYEYKMNDEGLAHLRYAEKGQKPLEIYAERITWSSAEQTLTLRRKGRITSEGLDIRSNEVVFAPDKGHVTFLQPLDVKSAKGNVSGEAGEAWLTDGELRRVTVRKARGTVNVNDGDGGEATLPGERRMSQ